MKTLKFKSNINCDGCIAKVTDTLDKAVGKEHWKVDITNPEKILTVETDNVTEKELNDELEKVGYKVLLMLN